MADLRNCIGSARFGIEAHDAPPEDFPVQPSQKDGLGRMCKPHWKQYTRALRAAAWGRQPPSASVAEVGRARADKAAGKARAAKKPEPIRTRPARGRKTEGDLIVVAVDAAIAREAANLEEASIA